MHRLILILCALAGAVLVLVFADGLIGRRVGWISTGWPRTVSWRHGGAARGPEPGPSINEWENEGGSLAVGAQGLPTAAELDRTDAGVVDPGTAAKPVGA